MKKVVLLLVSVVLIVGVIGTVSAGAVTSKVTESMHVEFPDEHCSDVPVWVVIDGIYTEHTTVNQNSTHFNFKMVAEAQVLDPVDFTLLDTNQVKSILNDNLNKKNTTFHQNHIFKGQFVDGTEWHGVLVTKHTLNANGDVVVEFNRENFINCP